MSSCPELGLLEARPLSPDATAHVAGCDACSLVVEAIGGGAPETCERFDALLAARADGTIAGAGMNLLARHLAGCAVCCEVAATMSPAADAQGDHATLPHVDPSAYTVGLEVARGGMGRILAARDLRVGRPIAIKELLDRTPRLAARFEREARVTARLQHPGILPIYDIGRWPDGTPFYTMRMVDGTTLYEAIGRSRTQAERLALLPAVIAATEAVAFAHGQRVIHRDLTPSNILLGAYGETVVIDWGLAKDLAEEQDDDEAHPYHAERGAALTSAGAVIGTAPYMPPEQAHAMLVDERADVYALGAILYHLLTGEAPYRAPTTRELLRLVKTGPPRPVGELASDAPRDLASIVAKAMSRDPEERYPTARELSEELKRFQTGRLVEAHAYSRRERTLRFFRRHRTSVLVTALAATVLTIGGVVSVSRILHSRAEARKQVTTLLEERGRSEWLAGSPLRALAYLDTALERGADTPSLSFLLAAAMRDVEPAAHDLDCEGEVRTFVLGPDGRDIAAACHDLGRVWRLDSGAELATLGPVPGGFDGVVYAHDGRTLATWGAEGKARIWDASGHLLFTLDHGAPITEVSYSGDDRRIATTGRDGIANVWRADGVLERRIVANTGILRDVHGRLAPDGNELLTVSLLGEARGWDVASGALLGGFEHGSLVLGGELARDGSLAATCGVNRLAKVWNARTGALVRTLAGHTDVVWKCVFSRDGKQLLTSGHDGRAVVWDLATGAQIANVLHGDVLTAAHFSADARRFVTIGVDGRAVVWDARTGARLRSQDTLGGTDAQFSDDGEQLIAQRGDGHLRVWNHASGPLEASFTPPSRTQILATLADGARVAIERADGAVELWDTRTARVIPHAAIHAPIATRGTLVAAASGEAILLIDATTGTLRTRIDRSGRGRPTALVLGETRLAVVDASGAEVLDLSGERVAALGPATGVLLDRSGARALVWRAGTPPVIWDLAGERPLVTLVPARSAFTPIAFASTVVLLEGDAGEPRVPTLWNPETGEREAELEATRVVPTVDPSGHYLTTIGTDHVVTVTSLTDAVPAHTFVAAGLVDAQADPSGAFVVGIGAYGTEAVVLRATDGQVLATWPISHTGPTVGEREFRPAAGIARWTPDGAKVVTSSTTIAVWAADREVDAARLASIVREQLPWTIVDGAVVWVKGRVSGRVVRRGEPVAGVRVVAEIRNPPDLEGTTIGWDTSVPRVRQAFVTTDADGSFALGELFPGEYRIGVEGVPASQVPLRISNEDPSLEIELPIGS